MKNKIINELKRYKLLIAIMLLLFVIIEAVSIANLVLSANLIDSLILKKFSESYTIITIIIVITILSTVTNYIFSIYKEKMINDFSFYIEKNALSNIYNSDYKEIKQQDKSTISQKILKDSANVSSFIFNNLFTVIVNIITVIALFIILSYKNILFAIISFSTIPLYLLLIYYVRNLIHPAMYSARENRDNYSGSYINKIQSIYTIKSYSIKNQVINTLNKLYFKKLHYVLKEYKIFYFFYSIEGMFTLIVQTIFFLLGIKYIQDGSLSIGDFTIILSFYQLIMKNVNYYLMLGKDYEDFSISVNRLDKLEKETKDNVGPNFINNVSSITFNSCQFKVSENKYIHYNNFSLNKGQVTKLDGTNGKGKSTLINILLGLYPTTKTVYINDIDISKINMYAFREKLISYLPQTFEFIEGSSLENINFYCQENYTINCVLKKLNNLKLSFDDSIIIKILDKNIHSLSEGQQQIIALMITFFKNTDVIILDEPFKALDSNNKKIVINYLNSITKNKFILLIEHNTVENLNYKTISL